MSHRVLFFPIPTVYREWFEFYHRFTAMGYKVYGPTKDGRGFIIFETPEDAIEFKLKYL